MNKVTFMFGLPASGKSTWININKQIDSQIISADSLKESHKDYDPNNPETLHEWSVKEAENLLKLYMNYGHKDIIFDGGGINNSYNLRLLEYCIAFNYSTKLVVLDTPAQVCLNRNKLRERKVPEQAIIDKAIKFNKCLYNLLSRVDEVEFVKYFTNKYIFVDSDGCIAAYQQLPVDEYGCIDFVSGQYFKYALPVIPVIDKLNSLKNSEVRIISAIPDSLCEMDKNEWFDTYFPIPYNRRYFIGNKKYKPIMLRNILKREKIDFKDVTVIDDDHTILLSYQSIGINAIHISEFLTWD